MPQVIDRSRGKPTVFEFASAGAEILIDDVTGDMYVVTENNTVRRVGPQQGQSILNGTKNEYAVYGRNSPRDDGPIPDSKISSGMLMFESDYNDGSTRYTEVHIDMAAPGGSYKRPFFAAMALSGGNAGNITETFLLADVAINFYAPTVRVNAAISNTTGALLSLFTNDTGGKDWTFYSSGSALGLGAGNCFAWNETDDRYGWICPAAGGLVAGHLAALSTSATDGFLYVPTCAGTPTGTPTAYTGKAPIVVNTTNNKLYFYSGGAWRDAGP